MFGLGRIGSCQERATGPVRRVIGRQRLDVQKICIAQLSSLKGRGFQKLGYLYYYYQKKRPFQYLSITSSRPGCHSGFEIVSSASVGDPNPNHDLFYVHFWCRVGLFDPTKTSRHWMTKLWALVQDHSTEQTPVKQRAGVLAHTTSCRRLSSKLRNLNWRVLWRRFMLCADKIFT